MRDELPTSTSQPSVQVEVVAPDASVDPGAEVYWHAPGYPQFPCDPNADPLSGGGYVAAVIETTNEGGVATIKLPNVGLESVYSVHRR